MSFHPSGSSTPSYSTSSTLISPSSPRLTPPTNNDDKFLDNSRIQASHIIEYIASRADITSTVYVYDVAEQVGFGTLTKESAKSRTSSAVVVNLQTRPGAGLSLVGRLSEGTSHETSKGAVLTAYTTPSGLALMASSLSNLPPANKKSRLIIHVPVATPTGENYALSATLAPLAHAWRHIPNNTVVLISSTPQQAVDFTRIAYRLQNYHVIHLFDHQGSTREIGHSIIPLAEKDVGGGTVAGTLGQYGYSFFDYAGATDARILIVLLNGPLALAAVAFAKQIAGLAVIVVNVLRPWDTPTFRSYIPKTVTEVHVFDDVPSAVSYGTLFVDVFEALHGGMDSPFVHSHRFTPGRTQQFMSEEAAFMRFVKKLAPDAPQEALPLLPPKSKKLFIFNAAHSPLAPVAQTIGDLFLTNKNVHARLLTDHDICRPGGVTANRLIISPPVSPNTFVPINIALPYKGGSRGQADFIGILDQSLLKTLPLVQYAKNGSSILLATSWTPEELIANIPPEAVSLIRERAIHLYTINANELSTNWPGSQSTIIPKLVYLTFLRLYLGPAATESLVLEIAQTSIGSVVEDISISDLCRVAWSSLAEVGLGANILTSHEQVALSNPKPFEFNAISLDLGGS